MSQFYALDFIYDGIPSQTFDLKILSFEDGSLFSGMGSADVKIYTQKVLRKAKVYYLGRSQQPQLEFELIFGSSSVISGMDRDIISSWLFRRSGFKKLEILQDDLNSAWFNCFLTSPAPLYVGNMNYAFKCKVICDSPFAYSPLKTLTRTYSGNNIITDNINLYNYSTEDDYLYPNITFELNTVGSSFSIINLDDNNREFLFTGLQPEEKIIVDNNLQTIVSSSLLYRLSNFNKNWLRLVPKMNRLHVESGIGNFTITYNERMKIGG